MTIEITVLGAVAFALALAGARMARKIDELTSTLMIVSLALGSMMPEYDPRDGMGGLLQALGERGLLVLQAAAEGGGEESSSPPETRTTDDWQRLLHKMDVGFGASGEKLS